MRSSVPRPRWASMTGMAATGPAANTMAGLASFGGNGRFVGKVKNDRLGQSFAADMRNIGVHFDTAMAGSGLPTACCIIAVTPDGHRSMNTYLGAAQDLHPNDIDADDVAGAGITYLEGYLWDPPHAKDAFRKAATIAHGAGQKVALTLSDAFCVDRYRGEFLELMRSKTVDLIFANESELHSLYQTSDFDTALKQLSQIVHRQAVVMSFGDTFLMLTVIYVGLSTLVFLFAKPANPLTPQSDH